MGAGSFKRRLTPIEAGRSVPSDLTGAAAILSAYPGAVIVFAGDGEPLEANEEGRELLQALSGDKAGCADLYLAGRKVLETDIASRESLHITVAGGKAWVDLLIMPTREGRVLALGRDATFETNVRAALVESRQRYKDLVDIVSDFAWETDADGVFVFVSLGGGLGYSADRLIGERARDLVAEPMAVADGLPFETRKLVLGTEIWLTDSDGEPACLLSTAMPIYDEEGAWKGVRGLSRNVTHERLRDFESSQVSARELVVAYIMEQIRNESKPEPMLESAACAIARALGADSAMVFLQHGDGVIELAAKFGDAKGAPAAERVLKRVAPNALGYEGALFGQKILLHKTRHRGEYNGAIAVGRAMAGKSWEPDDRALMAAVEAQLGAVLAQITDQRRLERLSRTDGLTGLLNRGAFLSELEMQLERAKRQGAKGALLFVDLDNFKPVNDRSGHAVGDKVLCEVAAILSSHCRRYDLVARLGGDEFALWLDAMGRKDAMAAAGRLIDDSQALKAYSLRAAPPLGVSVGIAVHDPNAGESVPELIERADGAMYAAKGEGKNRCVMAAQCQVASD